MILKRLLVWNRVNMNTRQLYREDTAKRIKFLAEFSETRFSEVTDLQISREDLLSAGAQTREEPGQNERNAGKGTSGESRQGRKSNWGLETGQPGGCGRKEKISELSPERLISHFRLSALPGRWKWGRASSEKESCSCKAQVWYKPNKFSSWIFVFIHVTVVS